MKDWKTVELPPMMKVHCKLDHRGLPIPYVVLIDKKGQSHFKVNDQEKSMDCILHDKCSICGQIMGEDKWMIGGPGSAFHNYGCYIDSPVHHDCGTYALQVCPYLAYSGYTVKTDIEKIREKIASKVILEDVTVDQNRVPLFVLAKTSKIIFNPINKYIKPKRPFLAIEFWSNGEKLEDYEGIKIVVKHFAEKGLEVSDYKIN